MITRAIQTELLACAGEYSSVIILGPRQSGKTTLAKMVFPDHEYCSLEDPDVRRQARKDPRGLLAGFTGGVILDEIQRVPELLSYLQGVIDADPVPGRFILTGSHQPQLHYAVTQSLAGRVAMLGLLPFSVDEAAQFNKESQSPFEMIIKGFYPRVHDKGLRPGRFYSSYHSTYIERDIRELINLKDFTQFEDFLRLIAGRVGQLVNYSSIANDIGVTSTTIKHWVSVLKASFILFELPSYYRNISKRVIRSSKLYFIDVGFAAWLLGIKNAKQVERDPLRGALYENLMIMEVVKQFLNKGERTNLHFYRDSKGNEVDLLIPDGKEFSAVEIKSGQTFQPEFVSGIERFKNASGLKTGVNGSVWYNGDRQTEYKNNNVKNPLIHGFDW